MRKKFRDWLDRATAADKEVVVKITKSSRGYLNHIAAGRRNPSAEIAGRIETAVGSKVLTRADLCDACKQCPYYQKCQK